MRKQGKRIAAILLSAALLIGAICCGVLTVSADTVEPTSVDLNRQQLFLRAGDNCELKLQALPVGSDLTGTKWSVKDTDVAFVSGGIVYAVSAGTTKLTVTTANGLESTCDITVANGEKLLVNGWFNSADTSMWTLEGAAEIGAGLGHSNTHGVKLPVGSAVEQGFFTSKANTYVVRANLKCNEDATLIGYAKLGDTVLVEKEISVGKSWGSRSFEFATGDIAAEDLLVIGFKNTATESLEFGVDNVIIAEKKDAGDLVVDKLTWEGGYGQVDPGTKLTFSVTVTNKGTIDVTDPFAVDIAAGTEKIQRLTYDKGVKAGETVTITADAPWEAVEGDFMMSATVNPEATLPETNYTTNNTYQINLRVKSDRVIPAYDAVAQAVADAGMHNLTFSEDFDDLTGVDTLGSGEVGYKWYVRRRWNQADMTRDDYYVEDGVFRLQHQDCTYAIGASTMDPYSRNGYSYVNGYLEVKFRIPYPSEREGLKGKPAIWSLPPGKWCEIPDQNRHWVEIDWLEYYGDGYYTITLHEQEKDENNALTWHTSSDNGRHGLDDTEWHVLGFLMKKDSLECFLDGQPLRSQTWGEGDIPLPVPQNQQGELKFEGIFSLLNTQENMLFLAGGPGMPMDVDYVRVWEMGGEPLVDEQPEETPEEKPEEKPEEEQPEAEEKPEPEEEQPEEKPEEDAPKPEEVPPTGATALPIVSMISASAGVWVFRKRNHRK